jgi:hypothetical protein
MSADCFSSFDRAGQDGPPARARKSFRWRIPVRRPGGAPLPVGPIGAAASRAPDLWAAGLRSVAAFG